MAESETGRTIRLGKLPPLELRQMPKFPGLAAAMGPGVIWAALAQGSGELIWWPFLTAKYGAAFIGLILPAALMQYFVNQEIVRYTITTGETFFTGMARIGKAASVLLWIMLVATFLWFGGYASSGATALRELFGWPADPRLGTLFWAYVIIAIFLAAIFLSRVIYRVIERFMTVIVVITIIGLIVAVLDPAVLSTAGSFFGAYLNPVRFLAQGMPAEFEAQDLSTLLTGIAFAGLGGFYNALYGYWVRDKGYGMARHGGRVTSPVTGKAEAIPATGAGFEDTLQNRRRYGRWIRYARFDNLFGIGANLLTLTLTVWLAWALLMPTGLVPEGWDLAVVQAKFFENALGPIGRTIFLVVAAAFLCDSWLSVTDGVARMNADFFLSTFPWAQRWPFRRWYFGFVLFLAVTSSTTMLLAQPETLLLIGGVLSFFAMSIYMPLVIYLNYHLVPRSLPGWTRPRTITLVAVSAVSLIYLAIAIVYLVAEFG